LANNLRLNLNFSIIYNLAELPGSGQEDLDRSGIEV